MGNVFKNLIKKRENRNTRSKAKHYPIRTLDFHQISSNKNGPIEILHLGFAQNGPIAIVDAA